jgi:hypothetical protein
MDDRKEYWLTSVCACRMLLTTRKGLEESKELIANYKLGKIAQMSPELWQAKKVVDSTIHPGALFFGTLYIPGANTDITQIRANQSCSPSECPPSSSPT